MGILADVSIPAAELYLMRFAITLSKRRITICNRRFCALLDFAQLEWTPKSAGTVYVNTDRPPIEQLTDEHFNLIQSNAFGFGQLFVWFPPRTQPSGDEGRLLVRADVPLKFVVQKIGVYIGGVSKYNG